MKKRNKGILGLLGGVEKMSICPTVKLEYRLEHKLKALAKHHRICESLKEEIRVIETEKKYIYFQLMNGKGIY